MNKIYGLVVLGLLLFGCSNRTPCTETVSNCPEGTNLWTDGKDVCVCQPDPDYQNIMGREPNNISAYLIPHGNNSNGTSYEYDLLMEGKEYGKYWEDPLICFRYDPHLLNVRLSFLRSTISEFSPRSISYLGYLECYSANENLNDLNGIEGKIRFEAVSNQSIAGQNISIIIADKCAYAKTTEGDYIVGYESLETWDDVCAPNKFLNLTVGEGHN